MDKYCIYKHVNKINGKIYIGQTKNVEQRWRAQGIFYKHSPHFYSAIQKYGWNNFTHEIIEDNLTEAQADEREKYYIQQYSSTDREKGYNILKGGKGFSFDYWTDERRQQQSQKTSEYMNTHEERKNFLSNYIKEHPEINQQHSEWMREQYKLENNPWSEYHKSQQNYSIKCIETNEIFHTLDEVVLKYKIHGVSKSNLCTHLNHPQERKSCGKKDGQKLHWEKISAN